jgi:hypothetical protein
VLELRTGSTLLSERSDLHALLGSEADWVPFDGDRTVVLAAARELIDSDAGSRSKSDAAGTQS